MRFKTVACNYCESENFRQLVKCRIEKVDTTLPIGDLSIVKCNECGLVYVNPRPEYSAEELKRLYSEEYFSAPYMRFYIDGEGTQSNEPFSFRLDWIEKIKRKGRILDIGCATGGFLNCARERGWDAYGVEFSKPAADIARDKHGLNVFKGRLEEAEYSQDFFDVVIVGDLLEHVEDPRAFLAEVSRILKKGGLLYIAVPDFDGLYYKIAMLVSLFNHRNYFVLPHHLYFFNRDTIYSYLRASNFLLLDVRNSESTVSSNGFRGKVISLLFSVARAMKKQDRILFLAKKM
jgi:2-polyprenyl-3-methyl-5-hydroxy-6-metoxy-1,4-benzoquinol methylase